MQNSLVSTVNRSSDLKVTGDGFSLFYNMAETVYLERRPSRTGYILFDEGSKCLCVAWWTYLVAWHIPPIKWWLDADGGFVRALEGYVFPITGTHRISPQHSGNITWKKKNSAYFNIKTCCPTSAHSKAQEPNMGHHSQSKTWSSVSLYQCANRFSTACAGHLRSMTIHVQCSSQNCWVSKTIPALTSRWTI